MDNLFEVIVPLIFAAIYFFGNVMSKKEEDVSPPQRRQRTEAEEEAEARQREIQEAIRRKILERRGGAKAPTPTQQPVEREAPRSEPPPAPVAPVSPAPEPVVELPTTGGFSWDDSDNIYQQQMEEQERRIEETRKRAEAIRKQASNVAASAYNKKTKVRRRGNWHSGPVRSRLNNPAAAREAIIYAEVLGQPVGLGGRTRIPSER